MGVLVVGGEKLSGTIAPAEPVAWYSLAVADGQWIGVERFAAVGVDTRIALYSEAGQVLAITDARFELNNPESGIADNFTIGAGSYLVGVGLRPVTFNHDFVVNEMLDQHAAPLEVAPGSGWKVRIPLPVADIAPDELGLALLARYL